MNARQWLRLGFGYVAACLAATIAIPFVLAAVSGDAPAADDIALLPMIFLYVFLLAWAGLVLAAWAERNSIRTLSYFLAAGLLATLLGALSLLAFDLASALLRHGPAEFDAQSLLRRLLAAARTVLELVTLGAAPGMLGGFAYWILSGRHAGALQ
jgi:hypothetical protein